MKKYRFIRVFGSITLSALLLGGNVVYAQTENEDFQNARNLSWMDKEDGESEELAYLYHPLKISGSEMGMEQVFSGADLRELAGYGISVPELQGLVLDAEYEKNGEQSRGEGLDLVKFLTICGLKTAEEPVSVKFVKDDETIEKEITQNTKGIILITENETSPQNNYNIVLYGDETLYVDSVGEILVGAGENPHYEMHNREPHNASCDKKFTFHIYQGSVLEKEICYDTEQLEDIALEHPEAVYGSWYGIIGNKEDAETMGTGGYLDYYEGLRLDYLLKEELGIEDLNGRAELFGREGELFTEIEDLSYFVLSSEMYYMCNDEGKVISGAAVPILAYSKNGSPLLPDHEHDTNPAYVKNNEVKKALEEFGIEEINLGTVKNHSGPFVAALGNADGYYGGYQQETSGDCIQIDLYLDEKLS